MRSSSRPIERAKPLLGTFVRMRVDSLAASVAHDAIGGAFRIVADIHRLMSFHEPASDLSRLNREATRMPVRVAPHTRAVLEKALEIARISGGVFDPTVAPALVREGLLPAPDEVWPDEDASWKDISIAADGNIRFARPLWIDLGGIAKGYAVDCAITHIKGFRPTRICVEAGGDLRLWGEGAERVYLAAPQQRDTIPALEIEDAAVASSGRDAMRGVSPHLDTRTGAFCPANRFVTIVAPHCMEADALTKVVMAAGADAASILAHYHAQAFVFDDRRWSAIAEAA